MKILVKILFVLMIFLTSCYNSVERKIIHDIRSGNRLNVKIESVQITDTLYADQIKDKLDQLPLRQKFYQTMIKDLHSTINSIRHIEKRDNFTDSLMHSTFERLMFYDRELDRVSIQTIYYEQLYNQDKNGICGYYATIKTRDGENYEFVVSKDYNVICSKFMLE
jgi:hypothetical protein